VAPLAIFFSIKFNPNANGWSEPYFDLVALLILVHLIPDHWTLVLVLGVVLALSPSFTVHSNSNVYYLGAAIMLITGMTIAAIIHDVPNWHLYIALLVAVYPGVLFYASWQMKRANNLREESQKLTGVSILAGGVAHDFNNLLTIIMGNTELAQLSIEQKHPAHRPLSEILIATKRAGLLSKQLLSFSGRQANKFGSYNLEEELLAITNLVGSTLPSDMVLTLEVEPNLPQGYGDPAQIQQVMLNLLLNATEASESTNSIHTRAFQETVDSVTRLVITVEDSGSGIEQELQKKIFDPFYSSKSRGHGLGLVTVKRIISEHGGDVTIKSLKDVGTTITVHLPTIPAGQNASQLPHDMVDTQNTEILVVDDEASVRQILVKFLEPEGYITREAENGAVALKLFEENQKAIKLILLDLKMPIMDGWECLKGIRKISTDIPVIIISGFNPEEEKVNMNDAHLTYITKPFLRLEILKMVAMVQ